MAGVACSNGLGNNVDFPGQDLSASPFGRMLQAASGAMRQSSDDLAPLFSHTSAGVSTATETFCDLLVSRAPSQFGPGAAVSVQLSGTDAVFFAVNAARRFAARKGRGRVVLVGSQSYHGSTDVAFGSRWSAPHATRDTSHYQAMYPSYDPLSVDPGESEVCTTTSIIVNYIYPQQFIHPPLQLYPPPTHAPGSTCLGIKTLPKTTKMNQREREREWGREG
jgi:hypothetical protein